MSRPGLGPSLPTLVLALILGTGHGLLPTAAGAQDATLRKDDRTYVILESERACSKKRCPEGHVCLQGQCLEVVLDSRSSCLTAKCADNQVCLGGRCLDMNQDYCERANCGSGEVCLSGACYRLDTRVDLTSRECGADDVVWKGRCLRQIEIDRLCPIPCAEGEVCLDGGCFDFSMKRDACADASCPSGWPCLGGLCLKPTERYTPCEFYSRGDCVLGFCVKPDGG